MEKTYRYMRTKFPPEVIEEAVAILFNGLSVGADYIYDTLSVRVGTEQWSHDDSNEFFSDYRRCSYAFLTVTSSTMTSTTWRSIWVTYETDLGDTTTQIVVRAPSRNEIARTFEVFDQKVDKYTLPADKVEPPVVPSPSIFIGHGRATAWRDLKDHLADQHGYEIVAYETGARGGHAIRDILQEMMGKASFALLVMTKEDETVDGDWRSRQNVVHEAGLFQGQLGFHRAIAIVEEGCEVFSNLDGVQQLRYGHSIREIFGDVLAVLRREFGE